jgi:deoxyribodipyrimidine photo-lyase
VFSPFYTAWKEHGWRAPARTGATSARWIDPADVGGGTDIPTSDAELEHPAGEAAAHEGWKTFLESTVDDYADDRNRPDHDGTSRMSAHLKFGTIHPRTMAADLGGGKGAQAYLRELAFRDFYASVVHSWPDSTWWNWNKNFDRIEVDEDAAAQKRFETWKAGRTGFPIVDAGMRQLSQTGFMHNRVRMITASFLVKDLHLPWQWGARWFLEQLTDGDMANNQHGWQWAAGCGTDAAPYFRVFNPTTQGDKFDPDGAYVKRWVAEYGSGDYPAPMVDHSAERLEALRRYEAVR